MPINESNQDGDGLVEPFFSAFSGEIDSGRHENDGVIFAVELDPIAIYGAGSCVQMECGGRDLSAACPLTRVAAWVPSDQH